MNPLVSIIVPIYKVPERFLRKCIESLIFQTLREIEIILVDDGSPDNCGEICDEYSSNDSRIKVIHKKNGGLSAARNTGFFAATGEWITFVDGDDWLENETCLEAIKASSDETELVFWTHMKDYRNSSMECFFIKGIEQKEYNNKDCKELQVQVLNFNSNIATAYAKLIKRELLVENKIIHDEELRQGAEGIDFNLRLFERITNATFINKPFYHYVFNEDSISAKHDEKNHYYVIKCFERIQKFIDSSDNREKLLEKYHERLIYVLITTAISGYFSPLNKEPFKRKIEKYRKIQNRLLFQKALSNIDKSKLSKSRRMTLFFIEKRMYVFVQIIAYIRRIQLKKF